MLIHSHNRRRQEGRQPFQGTVMTSSLYWSFRKLTQLRHDARNATTWTLPRVTRSVPTSMVCSGERLVKSRVSHTRMQTRTRQLSGRRTLWYGATNFVGGGERLLIAAPVRIPRKPQEIHPGNQDGFRRSQEGQGQERPDHVRLLRH